MILDSEKYLPFMEGLELSRERKEEIILTVWGIMESQVDQAFGLHPIQLCTENKRKNISQTAIPKIESKEASTIAKFNFASENPDAINEREKDDQK